MHPTDLRTLLVALRDLLVSASGLVNHLLEAHGSLDTIVTPPPAALLALPSGARAVRRAAPSPRTAKPARGSKRRSAAKPARKPSAQTATRRGRRAKAASARRRRR